TPDIAAACTLSYVDVSSSIVTPVPVGGFQPGDVFTIRFEVTATSGDVTNFRLDITELQYWDWELKMQAQSTLLNFGDQLILRNGSFSHGQFYRASTGYQNSVTIEPNVTYEEDSDISTGYTWVIDEQFRNGVLKQGETATLELEVELMQIPGLLGKHSTQ